MGSIATSSNSRVSPVPWTSRFRFVWHASQIGGAQIIRRAARFVFLFVVARKLGPEVFGVYALLLAIVETLSLISGEGFIDYLAREVSKSPGMARGLYTQITQIRYAYSLILLPAALLLLHLLKYPAQVLGDASWLFLILFARAPLASGQGIIRAVHRVTLLVWLEAIQGAVLLMAGFLLLWRETSLRSVIEAELASSFAAAFACGLMVRHLLSKDSNQRKPWRELLRSTSAFNIYPLITNIYDRVDVILLSVLAGNFAAGVYALPYRALATLQIIPFGLMTALLPSMAPLGPSENDKNLCSQVSTVLFALSLFPVLVIMLLAGPLISFVLGKNYSESIPIFKVLIWAAIPMFVNFGLNTFLLARSKERVFIWTSSVCAVVNIACNVVLIPRFSFYAAAAVTILTESVLLVQHMIIIRRMFGFFPVPNRLLATSLIFSLLLLAGFAGSSYASPLALAVGACLLFAVYLCLNGSLRPMLGWMTLRATAS